MASITINVTVRIAWWWRWYAFGVVMVARLMQTEPDPAKVQAWARRAVKVVLSDVDQS